MKDKELERLNNEIKQYKEYIKELKDSLINYHIKNNKLINKNEEKDKEIERLNNIINELEKYLEKIIIDGGTIGSMPFWYRQIYDYLQELKGSDK